MARRAILERFAYVIAGSARRRERRLTAGTARLSHGGFATAPPALSLPQPFAVPVTPKSIVYLRPDTIGDLVIFSSALAAWFLVSRACDVGATLDVVTYASLPGGDLVADCLVDLFGPDEQS